MNEGPTGAMPVSSEPEAPREVREPEVAILILEDVIEDSLQRMRAADDDLVFVRLANSLSISVSRLVNAHKALSLLRTRSVTRDQVQGELDKLAFDED